jgi:hypothetical protein
MHAYVTALVSIYERATDDDRIGRRYDAHRPFLLPPAPRHPLEWVRQAFTERLPSDCWGETSAAPLREQ